VNNHFSGDHDATVSVDYAVKHVNVRGAEVQLQLWDIAGQARYGANATKMYYRDALGVVLVYDCSRPKTFDAVSTWKSEIDGMIRFPSEDHIPVVLVGNKCDVELSDGQVDRLYADRFCSENSFLAWYDTSACTGEGIEEALRCLVEKILMYPGVLKQKLEGNSVFKPGVYESPSESRCF